MLGQNNYDAGPLIYAPKKGPNAVKKEKKRKAKASLILDVLVVLLVAGATFAMFKLTSVKPENTEKNNPEVVAENVEDDEDDTPKEMTLQPVINSWYSTFSRETEKGIMIYDLDNEKVIGALDEDKEFDMASVYKLLVIYEGYKRVELGDLSESGESYGGMTVGECLDKAIRESHSGCAENLLTKIGGEAEMDRIIRDNYGLEHTSVTSLSTTASDMVNFLKILYKHKEISEASYARLADSMLNQPKTESEDCEGGVCDYRAGLPAGFDNEAKVYNKVGWGWNGIHWLPWNDVALVEFPKQNRHFAIAFLSTKFPTIDKVTELGKLIEEAILAYFEYE